VTSAARKEIEATRGVGTLLAFGVAGAAVYGLVFTLWYPVTRFPGLPTQIPDAAPGLRRAAPMVVGWLLLFALYYAAYRLCPRRFERRHVLVVMGFSILFGALMIATYPIASTDVFDYIGRAHFITDRGGNPMLVSPASIPNEYPYFHYISSIGVASPYGPLWQGAGSVVARLAGGDVLANVLGMKVLTMACYWAGMPLTYRTLMRLDHAHALRGLLLYAWCPAALFEFGASGHNDAMLVLGLVVAAYLLVTRRPGWAVVAVMAASLVKFSPLILLPFFLVAAWRMPATRTARVRALVGGGLGAVALTAVAYAPFGVVGFRATITTLFSRGGDLEANSLPWALSSTAHDWFNMPAMPVARWAVRLGLALVALALIVCLVRLVRRNKVTADDLPREVIRSSLLVLLVLLATAVPFFWPWYILWVAAFAPLLSERGPAALFTAFACGGFAIPLTTAYYGRVLSGGFPVAMALLTFGPLLATAAWLALSRPRAPC
jgi:hypothetical protein